MAMPSGYKPSPLGYGSPRSSPFRRPESPISPSTSRQTTPTPSPTKSVNVNGGLRFDSATTTPTVDRTPRAPVDEAKPLSSPVALRSSAVRSSTQGTSLSQLQPAQVRMLRDGFQILDRDSDGVVNREDVADMLSQLGLPSDPSAVTSFFPPSAPQTMSLAVFLNSIATSLAAISPSTELLSAFSAFDDDDSDQIDLAELRDALLHTAPEPGERALTMAEVDKVISGFTGRRAFSKSRTGGLGKKGEVFRYQEFVNSIGGGNGSPDQGSPEKSDHV